MSSALKSKIVGVNEQGLSLVELILGIMIIGFMVMLVMNLPSSLSLIGKSRFTSIAKDIASQKVEDTRAVGFDNLADGSTSFYDPRLSSLPSPSANLTVSDCPVSVCKNGEEVKQITVTVNWIDKGSPGNVILTTLVAKGGLQ